MRLIYVDNRPFKTMLDAALEITRISGDNTELWQVACAVLYDKGFVNGVPVVCREAPESGALLRYPRGEAPFDRGICRAET
jgi:hypothetical protein